jgi:hypothetical protein
MAMKCFKDDDGIWHWMIASSQNCPPMYAELTMWGGEKKNYMYEWTAGEDPESEDYKNAQNKILEDILQNSTPGLPAPPNDHLYSDDEEEEDE